MTEETTKGGASAGSTGVGTAKYDPDFANEVFAKVDSGDKIKTCIQCGVCAASCPLVMEMDFPPRKIFTLIRAGRREEVLSGKEILLCTSCYTCKVRCPRKIPVIDVMHGLARYAVEQGLASRKDTVNFGKPFWKSIYKLGRIDEKRVSQSYFLAGGLIAGLKKALGMRDIGRKMMLRRRMKLLPERPIRGIIDLRKMLDKAETLGKGGAK